jgi:hypothetical protein
MRSEIVYIGSEIKLNISLEPIGNYTMDNYDFECEFYCYSNRRVLLTKDGMIRQDESNYIALLDSKSLGTGTLKCKITAYIPDVDCEDGLRTEVLSIDTGIQIQGA